MSLIRMPRVCFSCTYASYVSECGRRKFWLKNWFIVQQHAMCKLAGMYYHSYFSKMHNIINIIVSNSWP